MNNELKKIKKIYGEETMHLCRTLFPTILEHEGLLLSILEEHFAPTKFLAREVIKEDKINEFKNYIYGFYYTNENLITVDKTPAELLKQAGYTLYECHTEEEIQSFKKYYYPGEEICTFSGNRLSGFYVFFVIKDNASELNRKKFTNPRREDEYGTSVISIQFSKDPKFNNVSIKNRYNHIVENPDDTFFNNLDNIIPGLTHSFENYYNLEITNVKPTTLGLKQYSMASDQKYHFFYYNYYNQIYFCENNFLIRRGFINGRFLNIFNLDETFAKEKERYVFMDTYVLDLKEKKLINIIDHFLNDFDNTLEHARQIIVTKDRAKHKVIKIINVDGTEIEITLDECNSIIGYKNPNLIEIKDNFMRTNHKLQQLEIPNVTKIGDNFLMDNETLHQIYLPKLSQTGSSFLPNDNNLRTIFFPNLHKVGHSFLFHADSLTDLDLPNLVSTGTAFLGEASNIRKINLPKLQKANEGFLAKSSALEELQLPSLQITAADIKDYTCVLSEPYNLKYLYLPNISPKIIEQFLKQNPKLHNAYFAALQRYPISIAKNEVQNDEESKHTI